MDSKNNYKPRLLTSLASIHRSTTNRENQLGIRVQYQLHFSFQKEETHPHKANEVKKKKKLTKGYTLN